MAGRFISQPRRMIAFGCASAMARAAASNSPSCRPLATSASGVPVTVSGTDQTTFRDGLSFFQMAGHPGHLVEILPRRLAIEVDAEHRRRRLLQPFFPGLQRMLAADRSPVDERAGELSLRFEAVRDAALVSTWARSNTLKTKAIKKKVSRLSPPCLRRVRSVRRIARPRQSLHKGRRKPSPHLVGEIVTGTNLRCLKSAHTGQSGCAEKD